MTAHHTHVCLVSAQATPNLLPLLDARWRPQRVVLACSQQMKSAARALQAVIHTRCAGMRIELLDLPDAYDYGALADAFLDYLSRHADEDIALNVTGGTKLMAVAAQEVFRSNDKPVFYVNVENDEVIRIGSAAAAERLQAPLKVHEMLRAHGHTVTEQQQPQVTRAQRELTARLIDHVSTSGPALGLFNHLARQARDGDLRARLDAGQPGSSALSQVIALFEDAGQVRQEGNTLIFPDEEARAFANGGWLESHVYDCLQSLRARHPALSDVALGVRIAFDRPGKRAGDRNELDVAFLYRHTLHIIECKTANLGQIGTSGDSKATEAIYKMESLLKLGGLRTKGMIVDYRGEFSANDANGQRARESGIEVVSGSQLRDFRGALQRVWFSAPHR